MNETASPEDSQRQDWEILAGVAGNYQDAKFQPLKDKLLAAGPPPRSFRRAPLIIDTHLAGTDDLLALAAATRIPELAIVVTSGGAMGPRGKFIKWLLRHYGRKDVTVAYSDLGGDLGDWAGQGFTPDDEFLPAVEMSKAVAHVTTSGKTPIRWLSLGSLAHLARFTEKVSYAPGWFSLVQLAATRQEAERSNRGPVWRALGSARSELPFVLTPDVTDHRDNAVETTLAALATRCDTATGPLALAVQRLDDRQPEYLRAPLALAVALELPFLDLFIAQLDSDRPGEHLEAFLGKNPLYGSLKEWLIGQLADETAK